MSRPRMNRVALSWMLVAIGALALALPGCAGCAYLTGEYACEADENCPFDLSCQAGVCVDDGLPVEGDDDPDGGGDGDGDGDGCEREHVREGDHEVETRFDLEALSPPEGECLVIEGDLEVAEVSSLDALEALVRVGGDLVLDDLEVSTLAGLERLRSVGGSLIVRENDDLESLDALERLREIGGDLRVFGNRSLPTCEAYELRDRLTAFGGSLVVAENQGECDGEGGDPP